MNKSELIDAIAAATGQPKSTTADFLRAFTDAVTSTLKAGDSVTIPGFGAFEVRERAARQGRNPATGATIEIPASKAPAFRPGKGLKDAL